MTFDDNACIRYLMKEMDPSEELLFEKKIEEDENLLIEVESLRKINQRLAELPLTNPPSHLTRQILHDASDHYKKNSDARMRTIYLSAAATILVIFFSGAFWIFEQEYSSSSDTPSNQAAVGSHTAPSFDLHSESSANGISPWVDQNQVLHFTDGLDSGNAAAFDSLYNTTYQRLQPLQNSGPTRDRAQGVHMTGAGSN